MVEVNLKRKRMKGNRVTRLTNPGGTFEGYLIHCPGCKSGHLFDSRWKFNGNHINPTFTKSMLVNKDIPGAVRCHSHVTDGFIIYLKDCDHELAEKTVRLPII